MLLVSPPIVQLTVCVVPAVQFSPPVGELNVMVGAAPANVVQNTSASDIRIVLIYIRSIGQC